MDQMHPAPIGWIDSATWGLVPGESLTTEIRMTKQRKPLPLLSDLLKADPTLLTRLEQEGRYHRVDAMWAFGSVRTSLEDPTGHPWRVEQEAAIQEIRATAQGTKRTKAGP